MKRALISFLGTGDYDRTTYEWPGRGQCETDFASAAVGRLWRADTVTLLATEQAERKNGANVTCALEAVALPAPRFMALPAGQDEHAQWRQFEQLHRVIVDAADCEILLDITHGFRAHPFLAAAVLAVLRASGDVGERLQVVYGEYRRDAACGSIWDLSLFSELIDWAQALGLFLKTGVAEPVVALARARRRRSFDDSRAMGEPPPTFHKLVNAMERFAGDLAAVRVASLVTGYEQDDAKKTKARGSARCLREAIESCRDDIARWLPPLALILDRLSGTVAPLVAERLHSRAGRQAQRALARHYLDLSRLPEAAIVVREARVSEYATSAQAVEINDPGFSMQARGGAERRFQSQDRHAREIASIRNDIEHAGYRKQPESAGTLTRRLDSLLNELPEPAEPETQPITDNGTRYFISRHHGAVEWAREEGIGVDRRVSHLDLDEIRSGDTVMGSLPSDLAAEVCNRGASYLHLCVRLPAQYRGKELGAEQLRQFGARLQAFAVTACAEA